MAQTDYLLLIEGIDGESKQKGYESHIDVQSWSMGITNSSSFGAGGGGATGKASVQDFHFTVLGGRSSEQLLKHCCNGKHITSAVLKLRKSGKEGNSEEYKTITFTDLVISSHQEGGNAGVPIPSVQISFGFAKFESDYKEQKNDGTFVSKAKASYDQQTGTQA
jgi:type VI secretion system secreted protein Hcp